MPILSSHDVDFLSRSPEQTRRLGIRLGALLKPGDVVWFKITMSNCRVNSQGYLGFEYQLASKTTEDLSSVYFHNEAH